MFWVGRIYDYDYYTKKRTGKQGKARRPSAPPSVSNREYPRTASCELPPIVFLMIIIFQQKAAVNEATIQIVWVTSLRKEESAVLHKISTYKLYDLSPYKLYGTERQKPRVL